MVLEARKAILRALHSGPKSGDDLRIECLGEKPKNTEALKDYERRYHAHWLALQSLIKDRTVEMPKYRLTGELADQKFIKDTMQRYEQTTDVSRHIFLMEYIEAESNKREAILTSRLIIFLRERLEDENEQIRMLAILSLRNITSKIDESRREDVKYLKRLREEYSDELLHIVSEDSSIEVRKGGLNLLIELGEPNATDVIAKILTSSLAEVFRQFKSILVEDLFRPYNEGDYSKNRLLRDYRNRLRDVLTDLRVNAQDAQVQKRVDLLRWKLMHGQTSTMPGEEEVD